MTAAQARTGIMPASIREGFGLRQCALGQGTRKLEMQEEPEFGAEVLMRRGLRCAEGCVRPKASESALFGGLIQERWKGLGKNAVR